MQTATNTIPKLTGLTDAEIQQCILDTVEYRKTLNITVDSWTPPQLRDENLTIKEWLELVGYSEIKHEKEGDDNKFGQMNVARAGRSLNLRMLEEQGVEDYIGTNFPKWKDTEGYRPYPDSKVVGTVSADEYLSADFKPTFTQELLERCREIEKLRVSLDPEVLAEFGGELVHPELQLIPRKKIHEPLREVINNETGKRDYHRGFQTRADEDYDQDTVDDIAEDMIKNNWDISKKPGTVFVLPEKYQYKLNDDENTLVEYGVGNLTHRWYANEKACKINGEEYLIAWVIKIDLDRLVQWATAVANRPDGKDNPRKDKDIIQSVNKEYAQGKTEFAKKLKDAHENNKAQVEILLEEHLIKVYGLRNRAVNKLIKNILKTTGVQAEKRKWTPTELNAHFIEHNTNWKSVGDTNSNQFVTDKGVFAWIIKDDTGQYYNNAFKVIDELLGQNRPTKTIFINPKGQTITKDNRDEKRQLPYTRTMENLRRAYLAGKMLFEDGDGHTPKFASAPEFDDENGLIQTNP